MDFGSKPELRIEVRYLLSDNAYLPKVMDDKKSWFRQMEVLYLIYRQFLFTTNSLGATPDHIVVLSATNTTDVGAYCHSY